MNERNTLDAAEGTAAECGCDSGSSSSLTELSGLAARTPWLAAQLLVASAAGFVVVLGGERE